MYRSSLLLKEQVHTVNLVILIASAILSLAAAANVGSSVPPAVSTSAAVTAQPIPTPTPSPAPVRDDVIGAGGPT
jgi:hypothetical protein